MKLKNAVLIIIICTLIIIFTPKSYAKYVFDYTQKAIEIEITSENLVKNE